MVWSSLKGTLKRLLVLPAALGLLGGASSLAKTSDNPSTSNGPSPPSTLASETASDREATLQSLLGKKLVPGDFGAGRRTLHEQGPDTEKVAGETKEAQNRSPPSPPVGPPP